MSFMKNKVVASVTYIVIGIFIIIGLKYFFPVCSGEMRMRCNYTADVEIGIGILIALLGIVSLFITSSKVRLGISIAQIIIGILIILIPTFLIGVCKSKEMLCHMAALPFLIFIGFVTIMTSTVKFVYLFKKGE